MSGTTWREMKRFQSEIETIEHTKHAPQGTQTNRGIFSIKTEIKTNNNTNKNTPTLLLLGCYYYYTPPSRTTINLNKIKKNEIINS